MSENMEHAARSNRNRKDAEAGATQHDTNKPNGEAHTAAPAVSVEDHNKAILAAKGIVNMSGEIKYKDGPTVAVDLPRGWFATMIHTDHSALMTDTHRLRQFCSTHGANAKSRAERLAKAIAKGDTAGIAENQPLGPEAYLALWADYAGPAIGDMQRMGSAERMRYDAGWSAYVQLVGEQNKYIDNFKGTPDEFNPPMPKAGRTKVEVGFSIPSVAKKGETDEAFEVRKQAAIDARTALVEKFLTLPQYAERVQIQLDRILAEKGKKADKAADETAVQADSVL